MHCVLRAPFRVLSRLSVRITNAESVDTCTISAIQSFYSYIIYTHIYIYIYTNSSSAISRNQDVGDTRVHIPSPLSCFFCGVLLFGSCEKCACSASHVAIRCFNCVVPRVVPRVVRIPTHFCRMRFNFRLFWPALRTQTDRTRDFCKRSWITRRWCMPDDVSQRLPLQNQWESCWPAIGTTQWYKVGAHPLPIQKI